MILPGERIMNELGQRIYDERKKKGLSQTDLATEIGVSAKAVSKWETGEAQPTLENVSRLAEVFHVSTDYLLSGVTISPSGAKQKDNFSYLEDKKATRKKVRIAGWIALGLGIVILLCGLFLFIKGANDLSSTNMDPAGPMIGIALLSVGSLICMISFVLLAFGYMGSVARYSASETAPVVKDTQNYMLDGTREETVKTVGAVVGSFKTPGAAKGPVCPKCGTVNEKGAAFCDSCGASLTKKCPACGEINDADAKFCRKCGQQLD
jgi:transcriptional regulator with XRE-family HTH domain/phage FluMu protein Com